jgi:isopentenyl-diphosphate delta-isomerase
MYCLFSYIVWLYRTHWKRFQQTTKQESWKMSENLQARMAERLDIVDAYGNPIGEAQDKKTIHAQGLRHRDVHVWVTNGTHMLQQHRNEDKKIMPGVWDVAVGEHVQEGETFLDAAVRGTREELGLELEPEDFMRIGRVSTRLQFPGWEHPHNIVGDNFVYLDHNLRVDDLTLQEEEVQGARWYSIDQLEDDLVDPERARLHAPQPEVLYALGIAGMRGAEAGYQYGIAPLQAA